MSNAVYAFMLSFLQRVAIIMDITNVMAIIVQCYGHTTRHNGIVIVIVRLLFVVGCCVLFVVVVVVVDVDVVVGGRLFFRMF